MNKVLGLISENALSAANGPLIFLKLDNISVIILSSNPVYFPHYNEGYNKETFILLK